VIVVQALLILHPIDLRRDHLELGVKFDESFEATLKNFFCILRDSHGIADSMSSGRIWRKVQTIQKDD
jgi:hypothetical protein